MYENETIHTPAAPAAAIAATATGAAREEETSPSTHMNSGSTTRTDHQDIRPPPTHNPHNIWGNVFVLSDIGVQSIHFVSERGEDEQWAYMSFEDPKCRNRDLANNRPFPSIRIPFVSNFDENNESDYEGRQCIQKEDRDCGWDADSRELKGWINIMENCGSGVREKDLHGSFVEVAKWRFKLVFDESFRRVVKGERYSYAIDSDGHDNYVGSKEYDDFHITYHNIALLGLDPLAGKSVVRIEDVAERGITLRQLLDVREIIYQRCEAEVWRSTNPAHHKKPLKPHEVTLYDLVEYLIKPFTKSSSCSYVEMVASTPQPPKWFVSHFWGEPVLDFIKCIQGHARDRELDNDTSYWICAYAKNQHIGNAGVREHPTKSSFFRAMEMAEGTVSVVDRHAKCFSRIWCSYELFLSFVQFDRTYNAYTLGKNDIGSVISIGWTDGPVAIDSYKADHQVKRQQGFPLSLFTSALKATVLKSNASQEDDKIYILNSICGCDLNATPPTKHEQYHHVDAMLRGKLVCSAYRSMLESGADMKPIRKVLLDAPIACFNFSFKGCKKFRGEALKFINSIPKCVEKLKLDYTDVGFESSAEFAVGLSRLKHLKSLSLALAQNNGLCCMRDLGEEVGHLTQLRSFELDIMNTQVKSCYTLGRSLENLIKLETLELHFWGCPIKRIPALCASLPVLSKLQTLILYFDRTSLTNSAILKLCRAVIMHEDVLEEMNLSLKDIGTADGAVKGKLAKWFTSMEDLKQVVSDMYPCYKFV